MDRSVLLVTCCNVSRRVLRRAWLRCDRRGPGGRAGARRVWAKRAAEAGLMPGLPQAGPARAAVLAAVAVSGRPAADALGDPASRPLFEELSRQVLAQPA